MRIFKLSVFLIVFSCALCFSGAARQLTRVGVLSPAVPVAASLDASLLDVDENLMNHLNDLDDPEEYLQLEEPSQSKPLIALQVSSSQAPATTTTTTTVASAPVVAPVVVSPTTTTTTTTTSTATSTLAPAPDTVILAPTPIVPATTIGTVTNTVAVAPVIPAILPMTAAPATTYIEPASPAHIVTDAPAADATQIAAVLAAQAAKAAADAQAALQAKIAAPLKEPSLTVPAPEAMLSPDVLKALGYPLPSAVQVPLPAVASDAIAVPASSVIANEDHNPGPDVVDSEADKKAADEAAFKAILAAHNAASKTVESAVIAAGVPADQASAIASAAGVAAVQNILASLSSSSSSTGVADVSGVAPSTTASIVLPSSSTGLSGPLVKPVVIDPTDNPSYPEAKVLFKHYFTSVKKADGTYDVKPLSPTELANQFSGLVKPADPTTTTIHHIAPELVDGPSSSSSSSSTGVDSSSSSTGPVFVNPEYRFNPNDDNDNLSPVPTVSLSSVLSATGFAAPEMYTNGQVSGKTFEQIQASLAAAVNNPRQWTDLKTEEQFHHLKSQYPVQPIMRDPPVSSDPISQTVQDQIAQLQAQLASSKGTTTTVAK